MEVPPGQPDVLMNKLPRLGFIWPTDRYEKMLMRHENVDRRIFHALCKAVGDTGRGLRRDGLPKISKASALDILEKAMNHLVAAAHDVDTDIRQQADASVVDWLFAVHTKGGCQIADDLPANVW